MVVQPVGADVDDCDRGSDIQSVLCPSDSTCFDLVVSGIRMVACNGRCDEHRKPDTRMPAMDCGGRCDLFAGNYFPVQ